MDIEDLKDILQRLADIHEAGHIRAHLRDGWTLTVQDDARRDGKPEFPGKRTRKATVTYTTMIEGRLPR